VTVAPEPVAPADQAYVAVVGLLVAVIVELGVAQVIVEAARVVAAGVVFPVTVVELVEVHPLAGLVTVTV
jgi:hypothetical protein